MNIPFATMYFEDLESAARASLAKDPRATLAVDPYALLVLLDRFKNPVKIVYTSYDSPGMDDRDDPEFM